MRFTLILPYWDRQAIADEALQLLAKTYPGLDMEVLVVDDGSPVPFIAPAVGLDLRVVRLPAKTDPKSPVTPWNEGVRAAKTDIIVLSCVEVLHERPILQQLVTAVTTSKDYVLAAAWCPEDGRWHCHNTIHPPRNPPGTGLSFCAALHKSLYWEAGGFDEAYREGAGYEDNDFIWRLLGAGAKFQIRDDLRVIHPKRGASIAWGNAKFARNEALFYRKWPDAPREAAPVNVCCVQWGNYCGRGAEYVNKLYDAVRRNLPNNFAGKFFCFTDDPTGLDDGIQPLMLGPWAQGWWNKLYPFKKGLFDIGEQVFLFDLDTLICGDLVPILSYRGEFAALSDFTRPDHLAGGVLSWRVGERDFWHEWMQAGRPTYTDQTTAYGEMAWIEHCLGGAKADRWQDLFPERFVSFKGHCGSGIPKDATVICFHGEPRPHEVKGWVEEVWKLGGVSRSNIRLECNVGDAALFENVRHACTLPLQWVGEAPAHGREALICGSGPSLMGSLAEIREGRKGRTLYALNNAAKVLSFAGIRPDFQVILDARAANVAFLHDYADAYLISSQCHPDVFKALEGKQVILWHPVIEGMDQVIKRPATLIGGGTTVGLSTLCLAYTMGHRVMHLYGYDSSHRNGDGHALRQAMNANDILVDVMVGGKMFKSSLTMAKQAEYFLPLAQMLADLGCEIYVHGYGLLPHMAKEMQLQTQSLEEPQCLQAI